MKKLLYILIFFISFFIISGGVILASSVFISLEDAVKVGDTFTVNINADTDGELINSIEMVVDYREDLMSFAGYKNDGTVVRLWVDAPHESDGKIYFSGIIPGGVMGLYDANKQELGTIYLTKLLFVARNEGNAEFTFVDTQLLKHDGKGMPLSHEQKNETVTISPRTSSGVGPTTENIFDEIPPEPFEINFIESSAFSKTPAMIVFNANDALSGIKQYKIKIGGQEWKDAKSPQQISRTVFSRVVTVRAYDHYDNFRDSNINIPGMISFESLWIAFALLILGILGYKLLKYRP